MKIQEFTKLKKSERDFTIADLAKKLGKSTGAINDALNRGGGAMKITTAVELLDALGCELIAVDKSTGEQVTITI